MTAASVWQPCSSGGCGRAAWGRQARWRPAAPPPRAQAQPELPSSRSDAYEYTYVGSDGRMKATFEQAFKNVDTSSSGSSSGGSSSNGSSGSGAVATSARAQAPWALGYQMSERYSMLWNDELKAHMLKVGLCWAGRTLWAPPGHPLGTLWAPQHGQTTMTLCPQSLPAWPAHGVSSVCSS